MLARPEITVSLPPDVANLPAPIAKLVSEHQRLVGEYRAAAQKLSDLDADRQHVEQRDAEDSAKALRARHLATSLATAADGAASDLIAAVEEARPAIFAKEDDDIAVAEQVYAKALERLEQAEVLEGVRELRPMARLEVWQQVEASFVEGTVAAEATQCDDAVGVVAATTRARRQVGRVDAVAGAADKAPTACHLAPLSVGGECERARPWR